jgi:ADP-ribose pyrophosphatase YjhB (NUDIX family)
MDKQPHITVATIVPRKDEFLMVEELQDGVKVYNQPAGHLEFGESLIDAATRETFEETNWIVKITHFSVFITISRKVRRFIIFDTVLLQNPWRKISVTLLTQISLVLSGSITNK